MLFYLLLLCFQIQQNLLVAGNKAKGLCKLLLQLRFRLLSVSWFGFVYFACFGCFAFLLISFTSIVSATCSF